MWEPTAEDSWRRLRQGRYLICAPVELTNQPDPTFVRTRLAATKQKRRRSEL